MDFKEGFEVETQPVIRMEVNMADPNHRKIFIQICLLFPSIKHVLQVAPLLVGRKTAHSGSQWVLKR